MGTDDNTKTASERRVGVARKSFQHTSSFCKIMKNKKSCKCKFVNIPKIQYSNAYETVLDEF